MPEHQMSPTVTLDTPEAAVGGGTEPERAHDLLVRGFRLMESWDDEEAAAIIGPSMTNAEAANEGLQAQQAGIAGVRGTYDWLHAAYEDLHWTLHTVIAEGEWVVARTTMSGRQSGPFITYTPDGQVAQLFPATGRHFAVTQSHWYRIADNQLVEHCADRDDLGQAVQLGWFASPGTDTPSS